MSRVWVTILTTLLVVIGVGIVVYGLMSGRWMWGLLFGVVAGGSIYEWLTLRSTGGDAMRVADRMIWPILIVLTELSRPAFGYIEDRITAAQESRP